MKTRKLFAISVLSLLAVCGAKNSIAGVKDVDIHSAYEDDSGHIYVSFEFKDWDQLNPEFFGHNVDFYGTSKGLSQLESAFPGDFTDPRLNGRRYNGTLTKDTKQAVFGCGDKSITYHPMSKERQSQVLADIRSGKIPLASLPTADRASVVLLKRPGSDQYIYVDNARYNSGKETHRLFVGEPKKMNERKLESFEIYLDGGSMRGRTTDGETLYVPAPGQEDKSPTWSGMHKLQRLDPSKFDLASLGIPGVPSPKSVLHTPCDPVFPDVRKTSEGNSVIQKTAREASSSASAE